jgi:TRAP-type mannitol/chloroaromatic compound transport system permease small subunit
MRALLWIAQKIDRLCEGLAKAARWALLADALLIAGNAASRKLFSVTAPIIFDLQWHFFAAVVLLMAAYTFQRDEHVRIDIFAHRLGERGLAWLDLAGISLVLLPLCAALIWVSWPQFVVSFVSGETRASRENLSDLPAWVIKGFIPLGFALLALQGFAEAIRCVASLRGVARRETRRGKLFEDVVRGR